MASIFYKLSCIDPKKECNVNEPISMRVDFSGVNPRTGRRFNQDPKSDDMKYIKATYKAACRNSSGKSGICCDPREFRIQPDSNMNSRYKNIKVRQNKNAGSLQSLDVCYDEGCEGDGWQSPTPYLMCKIGENTLPTSQKNVLKYQPERLKQDCPISTCGTPKLSFGELIKGTAKALESSLLNDMRLRGYLKDDNVTQLKDHLDSCLLATKKSCANQILTDNDDGDPLIIASIKENAIKCVGLLLSNGADLSLKTNDGRNVIHMACIYGNPTMITQLINAGGDTGALDNLGRPPLFYACRYNDYGTVNYILGLNPAMINAVDKKGNTALHIVFAYGKDVDKISQLLLGYGLNSGIKNKAGYTASELGRLRRRQLEKKQADDNSGVFLESFTGAIGQALEAENIEGKYQSLISTLDSGLTRLDRANVSENQNKYAGFITAKNELDGPVEFETKGCYPYANSNSEADCLSRGGNWVDYHQDDLTTVAQVDYGNEDDEDEEEIVDTTLPDQSETEIQAQKKKAKQKVPDHLYYNQKTKAVPIKNIPNLDHASIMGLNTPAPTSAEIEPDLLPDITPTPTSEVERPFFELSFTNILLMIVILALIVAGVVGVMFFRQSS